MANNNLMAVDYIIENGQSFADTISRFADSIENNDGVLRRYKAELLEENNQAIIQLDSLEDAVEDALDGGLPSNSLYDLEDEVEGAKATHISYRQQIEEIDEDNAQAYTHEELVSYVTGVKNTLDDIDSLVPRNTDDELLARVKQVADIYVSVVEDLIDKAYDTNVEETADVSELVSAVEEWSSNSQLSSQTRSEKGLAIQRANSQIINRLENNVNGNHVEVGELRVASQAIPMVVASASEWKETWRQS